MTGVSLLQLARDLPRDVPSSKAFDDGTYPQYVSGPLPQVRPSPGPVPLLSGCYCLQQLQPASCGAYPEDLWSRPCCTARVQLTSCPQQAWTHLSSGSALRGRNNRLQRFRRAFKKIKINFWLLLQELQRKHILKQERKCPTIRHTIDHPPDFRCLLDLASLEPSDPSRKSLKSFGTSGAAVGGPRTASLRRNLKHKR
jgi:hypothetical protein